MSVRARSKEGDKENGPRVEEGEGGRMQITVIFCPGPRSKQERR